jgi:superfamily II DNA or RNA helicase
MRAKKRRGLPTLRRWQVEALAKFEAQEDPDFLAVATPGAGKTTFALMAARRALIGRRASRVIVVVPTAHLKLQWADAAEGFGLRLDPQWRSREKLPQDMHGVVVTYQQAAAAPHAIARIAGRAIGILDEVHHAAESRAWGDAIQHGLYRASRRLSISGTPFRSDDSAIPFIRYAGDEAQPDYEYGYGEALDDHEVVRPVFFPRVNGLMEWRGADGESYTARFDDPLGEGSLASQRLRTALSLEGEWLPDVIRRAHTQLEKLTPNRRGVSRSSAIPRTHGSWPCAWSPRVSTCRVFAWVSTQPPRSRISSSVRRWDAWCVGSRARAVGRARTCSSRTTPGFESMRSRSSARDATSWERPRTAKSP